MKMNQSTRKNSKLTIFTLYKRELSKNISNIILKIIEIIQDMILIPFSNFILRIGMGYPLILRYYKFILNINK